MTVTTSTTSLFPLQAVLFPGGLLRLKVFEARYLDLMAECLREQRPFGVVALKSGAETGRQRVEFETIGTLAELIDVDSERPNILQVRCRGTQRFSIAAPSQRDDGLWLAETTPWPDDDALAPSPALMATVRGLATAIAALKNTAAGGAPFLEPYRFDDAAWVANRWCEILPIPQLAKQKLMELTDPLMRLQLVDDFLRSKGVVK